MDRQQDVSSTRWWEAQITAYRFQLENERHERERNMSRLTEKLALAAAVAPRQAAKIEARADRILAREPDIERRTDDVFVPHERLMDEAEQGLDGLDAALRLMSNNPPLEHSTPLPVGPRVLPDGPAGVGDLNLPKAAPEPPEGLQFALNPEPALGGKIDAAAEAKVTTDRVALGPHPDQPEGQQPASQQPGSASASTDPGSSGAHVLVRAAV